jgi:bifunctional DNase/RNase
LLKGIRDNQKKRDNWFSNFFVLILKALYTQDLNSLHIWIKCLEEAAFMAVLSNADNQKLFSYKLQLNVPLNHHIQGR